MEKTEYSNMLMGLKKVVGYNKKWLSSKQFKEMIREQGQFALGLKPESAFDYSQMSSTISNIYTELFGDDPCQF